MCLGKDHMGLCTSNLGHSQQFFNVERVLDHQASCSERGSRGTAPLFVCN